MPTPLLKKVKTEHHILDEFYYFLAKVENDPRIKRMIPGRVDRQQSGRSGIRFHFSYLQPTGMKYKMIKGSTGQELFILCADEDKESLRTWLDEQFLVRMD